MKVALITSENIVDFPPIISLIKTLSELGHETVCITPGKDAFLRSNNIVNLYVSESFVNRGDVYYSSRLRASYEFRKNRFLKKLYTKKLAVKFSDVISSSDIVWVLHERTAVNGGNKFVDRLGKFIFTMYELRTEKNASSRLIQYTAQKANANVVAEYCRAHITKAVFGLSSLPFVLPNKPQNHPTQRFMDIPDSDIARRVGDIEKTGRKIILYMGIMSPERPLGIMIEAFSDSTDYAFAALGPRTRYVDSLIDKYGDRFIYFGSLPSPEHLSVASHAHIGYVCYVPQDNSINAVFCAPNKTYEYAGFGIPMICNDNPGLKFSVEPFNAGVCFKTDSPESILNAVERVERDYAIFSNGAKQYFDSTDTKAITSAILFDFVNKLEV